MENKKPVVLEEDVTVNEENLASSQSDQSKTGQAKCDNNAPVIATVPEEVKRPLAAEVPEQENPPQEEQVHIEPHLPDLITGIAIPLEEGERAREQRNLNHTIHRLLIVGLAMSVSFMIFGLFLDLILHRMVPTSIPNLGEVFTRAVFLRPSGFLALGLLVLIATPVLRVVGSILAFMYEHDWRYAGVTSLVLLVVILSIVMGKG